MSSTQPHDDETVWRNLREDRQIHWQSPPSPTYLPNLADALAQLLNERQYSSRMEKLYIDEKRRADDLHNLNLALRAKLSSQTEVQTASKETEGRPIPTLPSSSRLRAQEEAKRKRANEAASEQTVPHHDVGINARMLLPP